MIRRMKPLVCPLRLLFASSLALACISAFAQPFPAKPLRMVVPFPPGGSVDTVARLIAQDRSRGCVVSESFFENNISAVVAPVRDQHGAVVAAMGITVQQARLDPALREQLIAQVGKAAAELSHRLNFRSVDQAA